jgi:signal peptidase I
MTPSGEPPQGAGGVTEPDWIDRVLDRATEQVESVRLGSSTAPERPSPSASDRPPIVPEPDESPVAPEPRWADGPGEPDQPVRIAKPARSVADGLKEIRWVESPQVTPASTPIARPTDVGAASTGLVASAVGRSAWTDDLAIAGAEDPAGWDKLSWQDLDEQPGARRDTLREQSSFGRVIREWGPVLFAAVAIALFVRLVLFQAYHIPSTSMLPTLEVGDRVVVNRLSYAAGDVQRGQVVVFAKPPNQASGENDLIKRVIGLPGETVQIDGGNVFIDQQRVEEPYVLEQESTFKLGVIPGCAQAEASAVLCEVPAGYVFVMGDNRRGSQDSRRFGPIAIDTIVGRAFMRVWPLNHLGQL